MSFSSTLNPFCSDGSLKQRNIFTISQSSPNEDGISSSLEEGATCKPVPPMTLNIIARNELVDIENCSDNGELTPIVTSRNEFVDYDDNFETASDGEDDEDDDDDDSIEVIQNAHEVEDSNIKMPLKSYSRENSQDCLKNIDVMVGQLNLQDNSDADSDKENRVDKPIDCSEKERISEIDKYCERKVTDALNVIKFDESKEMTVTPGPAAIMEDDCLERTADILLITSTPAVSKRIGKKRMSRDIEDKLDLDGEKKFVDGSYVGFGRHRDGSNLGNIF